MLETLEADFDRCREYATKAGRDASSLVLGLNRAVVLEADTLPRAADTLQGYKARGVQHAIALLDPTERDPEGLLEAFAGAHLGELQS